MDSTHESRFAACHPAVCFAFFAAAIVSACIIQHPVYLAISFCTAACLLLTLKGTSALKFLAGLVPLFLLLSAVNPLFNTGGQRVLFHVFGRPYTLEALYYGMAVAGMLLTALVWFSCYNQVMTSDKFTCLFGSLMPALSLVLVMVLRLVPAYRRKAQQIAAARSCIGRSACAGDPLASRIRDGSTQLSVLTSWALEGAVITADSMRSRGYGCAKRTSFRLWHFTGTDCFLLALVPVFVLTLAAAGLLGWLSSAYTPELAVSPVTGPRLIGAAVYGLFLIFPTLLNVQEELKWKFFISGI